MQTEPISKITNEQKDESLVKLKSPLDIQRHIHWLPKIYDERHQTKIAFKGRTEDSLV